MTFAEIDAYSVSVFIHVSAVVVGLGSTFALAVGFPLALRRGARHLPYVHDLSLAINQRLGGPALLIILITGIYQTADADWGFGSFWISATMAIVIVLGGLAGAYFIPTDRRLGAMARSEIESAGDGEVVLSRDYQRQANREGAIGGVASAAIVLARHAGLRVWVTSRDEAKRSRAVELGAHEAFESGARLPERVDAVLETVGEATWRHSLRAVAQGGTIVVTGATSGDMPPAELRRVFFLQLRIVGSTMGTRAELGRLARLLAGTGIRPQIDRVLPLEQVREGLAAMAEGDIFGKIVIQPRP